MDRVVIFSAVNTKIKSLERDFLNKQNYLDMLKMANVVEAARYLKENTSYQKLFEEIKIDTISRRDIEDILIQKMITNIDKLTYYFRDDYRVLVRSFYLKYEIRDLKILARSIFNGENPKKAGKPLSFLGKHSKIVPEKLFKARTVRDLIYLLEGSEFFEFLIPLIDGKRENLFRFEMVLDNSYYSITQKQRLNILPADRYLIKKWEGLLADLYNIQWIYRGKKFYRLSPEELLNYTINFGDRLTYKDRQKMCYSKSSEGLDRLTANSVYGSLFKKEDMIADIYMERYINRVIFYRLEQLNRKFPLSIIQTIAHIWKLEIEIKDIIAIVESIRYKLPGEEAKKYLVRVA